MQIGHMHITDVTVTNVVAASTFVKAVSKIVIIDVANRCFDEVATSRDPITIH